MNLAFLFSILPREINSYLNDFRIFRIQPAPFYLISKQAECLAVSFYSISLEDLEGIIMFRHTDQFALNRFEDLFANELITQ